MKVFKKSLADVVKAGTDRADPKDFPDWQYIGMADVESGTGRILNECSGRQMKATSAQFKPGDVLYGRLRPYLNKVVRANSNGLASTEFIVLRPVNGLDSSYLAWRLRTDDFVNYANSLNTGDRPRVKFDQIASFNIEYPSLDIQQKTVDTLETQFTRLDAAIKSLKAIKNKLEWYRQSVLNSAFDDFEKEETIANVFRIIDYRGRTPPYTDEGIVHLRTSNIRNGKIILKNLRYVSESTYQKYMTRGLPEKGDILMTTEAPLGEATVIPDYKFSIAQRMVLLRPKIQLIDKYVLYQIMSPDFQRRLKGAKTGTTVAGVSSRNFKQILFRLHSLDKQEEIVGEIESRFSIIEKIEETVTTALLKAERLRKSILKAAFEGKLVEV